MCIRDRINLIKNKLRAAGQRDPMVMAVDACEETVDEGMVGLKNVAKGIVKATKAAGSMGKKSGKMLGDGAGKAAGVVGSGVAGAAAGMAVGDKILKKKVKKNDNTPSTNIKTTDNPDGGVRKKNDPTTYPSGVGEGP